MFDFSKFTNFLGGNNDEENLESLSHEDLLKRASEIQSENIDIQSKINKLTIENSLLNNSIINHKNNKSEFSKFLNMMENYLLNSKNSSNPNDYSIDLFKQFLYKEQLFFGILDEENIKYLEIQKDNKFNWANEKESYQLRQDILGKNLKDLYSNMFIIKENSSKKNIKKNESKEKLIKHEIKEEVKDDNNNKNNNNNKHQEKKERISNENKYIPPSNDFIAEKKSKEVNLLEDFLLNDHDNDEDNDDDDNEN